MGGDGGSFPGGFDEVGHGLVRRALSGPILRQARVAARREIERVVAEEPPRPTSPRHPGLDYLTSIQLGDRSPVLAAVVRSPRLARLAAAALGVERVRLLYDQLFAKPPGAVRTLWHQDQPYWPVDTSDVIEPGRPGVARVWVTLSSVPAELGGLHFVDGSHRLGPVDRRTMKIRAPGHGDTATIAGRRFTITDYGALRAGDATVHAGFTLHGARSNPSTRTRYAISVVYVPDGARVAEPADEIQELGIALYLPGKRVGDAIDSAANPVVWPAEAA